MGPDSLKPNGAVGSEADHGDEAATRVASSPDPASELASDGGNNDNADDAGPHLAEEKLVEDEPVIEAAASVVVDDEERGADQDPEAVAAEHERQLALDLDELMVKASKADEYLELAQRTKADFENFRKRAAREAAAAQERGVARLARELLPAVDNLDRALQVAEAEAAGNGDGGGGAGGDTLASGIKLVHADVIAALARVGISPYSPKGEPFDPQCHEAVAQQPAEGAQPGTVVEVYQVGYRLGESVLRPARVVVAG